MKKYLTPFNETVQAFQYKKSEANNVVRLCELDLKGDIQEVPRGLLGIPKNPLYAVKNSHGWARITEGDWVVSKEGENFVVPYGIFVFTFKPVED